MSPVVGEGYPVDRPAHHLGTGEALELGLGREDHAVAEHGLGEELHVLGRHERAALGGGQHHLQRQARRRPHRGVQAQPQGGAGGRPSKGTLAVQVPTVEVERRPLAAYEAFVAQTTETTFAYGSNEPGVARTGAGVEGNW